MNINILRSRRAVINPRNSVRSVSIENSVRPEGMYTVLNLRVCAGHDVSPCVRTDKFECSAAHLGAQFKIVCELLHRSTTDPEQPQPRADSPLEP
jgi:hypothetical protein